MKYITGLAIGNIDIIPVTIAADTTKMIPNNNPCNTLFIDLFIFSSKFYFNILYYHIL